MAYSIQRQDTSDVYEFSLIQSLRDNKQQQSTPLPIPGNQPEDSILFTLGGASREIRISWLLHDDGTDKSNGTHTSTVVTIEEQKEYWQNTLYDGSLGVQYVLTGDALESGGVKCVVSQLNFDIVNDQPLTIQGQLTLTSGTV